MMACTKSSGGNALPMLEPKQILYHINGIKVEFPVKAYPTQITMMHKILSGLEKKQNCLLESPTGSGKSLALLCSCLAWQTHEKERIERLQLEDYEEPEELCKNTKVEHTLSKNDNSPTSERIVVSDKEAALTKTLSDAKQEKTDETEISQDTVKSETHMDNVNHSFISNPEVDDEDFKPTRKRYRAPQTGPGQKAKRQKIPNNQMSPVVSDKDVSSPPRWTMEVKSIDGSPESAESKMANCKNTFSDNLNKQGSTKEKGKDLKKRNLPKIFFGTRTHKQIAQIIRELKKTVYKDVRMTILSSRKHTCIHPSVSKSRDKNEECKRLVKGLDGGSCRFHNNASALSRYYKIGKYGLDQVWDIEELVVAGKKGKACPYFAARELMKDADIVFCPYNYLVDPLIRSQMDIIIKDQIIILDEAHNIEDSSRDAASLTVTGVQLNETITELDELVRANIQSNAHKTMQLLCTSLRTWMEGMDAKLKNHGFEHHCITFSGQEMVSNLRDLNITPITLPLFTEQFNKILAADIDPTLERSDDLKLGSKSLSLLRGIMLVLGKLLNEERNFANDYHIVVSKTTVMAHKPVRLAGGWKRKSAGMEKMWTFTLNFWCLNPAVVFSEIGSSSRCIVLSSGTLSPMDSFSSELGVQFPIKLEANHVISDSQIWAGALLVDPHNASINASYKGSETFAFQDGVGHLILEVCKVMKNGVLCFFPSYSMIDKLSKRWQMTGLWSKIEEVKVIVSEPRGSDRTDFDAVLRHFYDSVKVEEQYDKEFSMITGALLLAVCRGKVSEGLDFSDENARAVITIGIPFPNTKDVQVELKRKYNTKYAASHGLLNGNEWYEIQAYRALNQALGRCIRHRNDWGALLLVDERFGKSDKYVKGLSKWVRNRVQRFTDFQVCLSSLADFSNTQDNACIGHKTLNITTLDTTLTRDTYQTYDKSLGMVRSEHLESAREKCVSLPAEKNSAFTVVTNTKDPDTNSGDNFLTTHNKKESTLTSTYSSPIISTENNPFVSASQLKEKEQLHINRTSCPNNKTENGVTDSRRFNSCSNAIAENDRFSTPGKPHEMISIRGGKRATKRHGFVYPKASGSNNSKVLEATCYEPINGGSVNRVLNGRDQDSQNHGETVGNDSVMQSSQNRILSLSSRNEHVSLDLNGPSTPGPVENKDSPLLFPGSPNIEPIVEEKDQCLEHLVKHTGNSSELDSPSIDKGDGRNERSLNPSIIPPVELPSNPQSETGEDHGLNNVHSSKENNSSTSHSFKKDGNENDINTDKEMINTHLKTKYHSSLRRSNVRLTRKLTTKPIPLLSDINNDLEKENISHRKVLLCSVCEGKIVGSAANVDLQRVAASTLHLPLTTNEKVYHLKGQHVEHVTVAKVLTTFSLCGLNHDVQLNSIYDEKNGKILLPLLCQICNGSGRKSFLGYKVLSVHQGKEHTLKNDKEDGDVILLSDGIKIT